MNTKICTKCKVEKSTNEFRKRKEAKDHLQSNCKECCRKQCQQYKDKNRQKLRIYPMFLIKLSLYSI
jgi:hypothetical protein